MDCVQSGHLGSRDRLEPTGRTPRVQVQLPADRERLCLPPRWPFFTGQTLAALQVVQARAPVTAQLLGLEPPALAHVPAVVGDLLIEAFLLDPFNAAVIAAAADPQHPQPAAVVAAQQALMWSAVAGAPLDRQTVADAAGLASAYGPVTVPTKIAVTYWRDIAAGGQDHPPRAPLFPDWSLSYLPSPPTAWQYPASASAGDVAPHTATWKGPMPTAPYTMKTRTFLT